MKKLYFIDLDGTLFNSDAFSVEFRKGLAEQFGITSEQFEATYENARTREGAYGITMHMEALGVSHDDAFQLIDAILAAHSYVFSDVEDFIRAHGKDEVLIVSQGEAEFQKRKAGEVEALVPIKVVTTMNKKRDEIMHWVTPVADHILFEGEEYAHAILVDNLARSFILPPPSWLSEYRIKRRPEEDRYSTEPTPEGVMEVATLADIP